MFFFFSSRRRHTRFDCDWSSDVCSSDLYAERAEALGSEDHMVPGPEGLEAERLGTLGVRVEGVHVRRFARADEVPEREARSEERRVGKECRSRWSPYH